LVIYEYTQEQNKSVEKCQMEIEELKSQVSKLEGELTVSNQRATDLEAKIQEFQVNVATENNSADEGKREKSHHHHSKREKKDKGSPEPRKEKKSRHKKREVEVEVDPQEIH